MNESNPETSTHKMNALHPRLKLIPLSALALLAAQTAFAQLSWDTRQLDFHPTVNEQKLEGEFGFTNIGQADVTLLNVKTSCGCTTAALDKKTYAPGEKGKIKATFTIGDRVGLQQKHVMVRTDSPEEAMVQLTIRAFIPELLKWEPKVVRWELNAKSVPQAIQINSGTGQAMNILGVRTSDDRIFAKLKAIEPGRKYEITVAPMVTTAPLRAQVWIETDYPAEHPKVYQVPVEVGTPKFPVPAAPTAAMAPAGKGIPMAPQPPRAPAANFPVQRKPSVAPIPAVKASTPTAKAGTSKK